MINGDPDSTTSLDLEGKDLDDAINQYFIQEKGFICSCKYLWLSRKGPHNSSKPRITLNFEIKRRGLFSKLLINLVAIMKFKIFKNKENYG